MRCLPLSDVFFAQDVLFLPLKEDVMPPVIVVELSPFLLSVQHRLDTAGTHVAYPLFT